MQPRIEISKQKKLIGKHMEMSFSANTTYRLWNTFMPRIKEIPNKIGTDLYAMQVYKFSFFQSFDPDATFEKWAAVEVTDFSGAIDGMETFILPSGLYAVFAYKGMPAAAEPFFTAIFTEWLPASGYALDDRPHFEILGDKYKNNDPDSEEEIWIPIKTKH